METPPPKAPGFLSPDTSAEAAEHVPALGLGPPAKPATVPIEVVRLRTAKDAYTVAKDTRDRAAETLRIARRDRFVVPQAIVDQADRAEKALATAKAHYKAAKAALPSRSVGRFLGGTRRRRNARTRKTRSKRLRKLR